MFKNHRMRIKSKIVYEFYIFELLFNSFILMIFKKERVKKNFKHLLNSLDQYLYLHLNMTKWIG